MGRDSGIPNTEQTGRNDKFREWLVVLLVSTTLATSLVYAGVQMFDTRQLKTLWYDDVFDYMSMARGEPATGIRAYRPMVPLLTRAVPELPSSWFSAERADNADRKLAVRFAVVNWCFLIAACLAMYGFCRQLAFSTHGSLMGIFLLCSSTTITRNAGLPMVDVAFAFWMLLICIGLLRESWQIVMITGLLGVLSKELVLLAVPLALLMPAPLGKRLQLSASLIPATGLYLVVRQIMPTLTPDDGYNTLSVLQIFDQQIFRLLRPNGWVNLFLAFGPAWFAAAYGWMQPDCPKLLRRWGWFVLLVAAGVLFGSGNLARSTFTAFPAVIPLAILGIEKLLQKSTVQTESPALSREHRIKRAA